MRQTYAHEAVLAAGPGMDQQAPGAAITVALCGHWEHEPPCPLAPHCGNVEWVDGRLLVRILFAAQPDAEDEVRQRIFDALSRGELSGPDGVLSRWELVASTPSEVRADEREHAQRLAGDAG